MAKIKQKQPL